MRASEAYVDAQRHLKSLVHRHRGMWDDQDRADISVLFDDLWAMEDKAHRGNKHELDDAEIDEIIEDIREAQG